jgi:predicted cytidylate kinase
MSTQSSLPPHRLVTVSGLPGSGTSTVCTLLAEMIHWRYINVGEIFRDMAQEQGASLSSYGAQAEQDGEIDRQLDARVIAMAQASSGGVILEGRLTGWMAHRHDLPTLKVWLQASISARAQRVGQRDGQTSEAAATAMSEREASEAKRYAEHHEIDISDLTIYDLVIDSAQSTAAQIAQHIAESLDAT